MSLRVFAILTTFLLLVVQAQGKVIVRSSSPQSEEKSSLGVEAVEPTQDLEGTVVEQHKSESSEIEERELSRPSSDLQNQAEGGKQTKEQEMAQAFPTLENFLQNHKFGRVVGRKFPLQMEETFAPPMSGSNVGKSSFPVRGMQKLWLQLVENSGPERKKFRTRLKRDAVFGQGLDNNYSQSTFSPTQTSTISQTQTSTTSQTQTSTLTTGTYNLGEEVASVSGPDVGTINGDKIEQTGAAEDRQDTSEIQSERMTAITDSQHGNTIPGSDSNVFTSSPEIAMYSEGNDKEASTPTTPNIDTWAQTFKVGQNPYQLLVDVVTKKCYSCPKHTTCQQGTDNSQEMVTCVPNLDNYSNPHGKRLQKEIDGNDSRWEELTQPKDSSAEESEANNLEHRLEPLRVQGESHESSDEGVFEEIGDSAVENGDLDYDSGAPVNIVARLNNLQAHESGGDEKGRVFLPESERVQGEDLEMKKHHKITEFNDQKWPVIADPVKHRKKTKKKMSSSVKDGPRLVAKAVRAGPEIANETIVLRESGNKAKPEAGAVRGEGKSDQGTRNQTPDRFEIENFESRGRKKRKDAGAAGVKDHGDDNPSIGQLIPQMMIDHNGRPVPVKGRFTTLAGPDVTGRLMPNGTLEGSKWKKKAVLDNDLVHRISLEEEQRAERDVGKALGPQGLSINGHGQIVQDPKEAAEKHANKQEGETSLCDGCEQGLVPLGNETIAVRSCVLIKRGGGGSMKERMACLSTPVTSTDEKQSVGKGCTNNVCGPRLACNLILERYKETLTTAYVCALSEASSKPLGDLKRECGKCETCLVDSIRATCIRKRYSQAKIEECSKDLCPAKMKCVMKGDEQKVVTCSN